MGNILTKVTGEEIIALTAIIGGVVVTLAAIAITQLRWAREAKLRAELMREMLHRGLSVDEIERLLRQTPGTRSRSAGLTDRGVEADLAALLATLLKDPGLLEEAIRAARSANPETKRAVLDAVRTMGDEGADGRMIAAAVHALCASGPAARREYPDEMPVKTV